MTNVLAEANAKIGLTNPAHALAMRIFVDLSHYWPDELSVNKAYEQLIIRGTKIDRRSLYQARKGQLARCELLTLVRLRDWAREMSGQKNLSLEDILVERPDEKLNSSDEDESNN